MGLLLNRLIERALPPVMVTVAHTGIIVTTVASDGQATTTVYPGLRVTAGVGF